MKLTRNVTPKSVYTPEITEFIRENYPMKGAIYCAEQIGGNFTALRIRLFAARIGIRHNKNYEGPTCNIEDFKNPSTPQMAYFLGLLWGDGSIDNDKVRLRVVKEDGLVFYDIIKDLANFRTYDFQDKKNECRLALSIVLSNRKLVKYLIEVGYKEKSLISPTKVLATIPKDLQRFFWLGFTDADGCFCLKKQK